MATTLLEETAASEEGMATVTSNRRPRQGWGRVMQVIRRVHLYAGLFLLPWVLLYGITGAMYNHQGLFPDVTYQPVKTEILASSDMEAFPAPETLAGMVVDSLQQSLDAGVDGPSSITLAEEPVAEFTNPMMFDVHASGQRYVVQIDPMSHESWIATHPQNEELLQPLLGDLHNISVSPDPHDAARRSAAMILDDAGISASGEPQPVGWTKLNFLADVDGQPARVTYVLKDGHVDVTRHEGQDGMSARQFFMRLHTSHGRSPHWNGRSLWSIVIDVMAIAMVTWGLSGLVMWWQIKRTRWIGGAVILLSVTAATFLYLGMIDFYATTKL